VSHFFLSVISRSLSHLLGGITASSSSLTVQRVTMFVMHDFAGRNLMADGLRRAGRFFSRREETVISGEGRRPRIGFGTCVLLSKAACKMASIPDDGSVSISIGYSMDMRGMALTLDRRQVHRPALIVEYFCSHYCVCSAFCTKNLLYGSLGLRCAPQIVYVRTVAHPTLNVWTARPTSAWSPATFVRIPTDIMGIWDQNLFGLRTKFAPNIRRSS